MLATKFYCPPARPNLVPRPRLLEELNDGLYQANVFARKLTLVSAPAGYGKTTLIAEWLNQLNKGSSIKDEIQSFPSAQDRSSSHIPYPSRITWLSLDESDNDPARFLAYFISALREVDERLGETALFALQSPQPPPSEIVLTSLINDLASVSTCIIMAIDDYHVINNPPIHQQLTFLLDHLPLKIHLVILTREDPLLPIARLRSRGLVQEIRQDDLQFTAAESSDFLERVMGLSLSPSEVAALEARTEGWIAGLQLAALAMQGEKDAASFIHSFTGSHRFVLDYLLEEVLHRQPPPIQVFLLRTSILERLCGPLCDAVLQASPGSGQTTLEALERANLFLIPLDNERHWYRYHHLFGDLLRQRLASPPELLTFHLSASQWYETHDHLYEAFHHALCANDFKRAAHLAEAAWPGMESSFQSAAWLSWVKKLPETAVRAQPELCYQLGRAFSDLGEPETSEFHLQNAERALAEAPKQAGVAPLPGDIALTRAYNAQVKGNVTKTIQYAELALSLVNEKDIYRRAQVAITLEFTHWASGNLESALDAIHAWMADMQNLGNPVFVIASAFAEADLLVALGRLSDAIQSYQQALQLASENGPEAQAITAHHHLGLALIYHELGDAEPAGAHLQTAADLGQRTTLVDWLHRWKLGQARLKESAGEWEAALGLLDEARRVYIKNPVPIIRPVEALKARIHLKQGRWDKAEAWVRERDISLADKASYLAEYELLTLALLHLDDSGVNDLLDRLLSLAEAQNRLGSALEILLTQSLAHEAQSNRRQALTALERALTIAEPQGYLRIFVDEGEAMRSLIADFRLQIENRASPLHAYTDKLLAAFPPQSLNPQSLLSDSLSSRELEILRLVAQGLSNTEISQRLYLALSTVKGHNQHIFDKLQAHNRTEAVARARELGLL